MFSRDTAVVPAAVEPAEEPAAAVVPAAAVEPITEIASEESRKAFEDRWNDQRSDPTQKRLVITQCGCACMYGPDPNNEVGSVLVRADTSVGADTSVRVFPVHVQNDFFENQARINHFMETRHPSLCAAGFNNLMYVSAEGILQLKWGH